MVVGSWMGVYGKRASATERLFRSGSTFPGVQTVL